MKKKIAPALFNLHRRGELPQRVRIIGFARRPLSDDGFRWHVAELIKSDDKQFLNLFDYNQGQFAEPDGYFNLKNKIKEIEREWGVCANKLFYLAVPPESYEDIFSNLERANLQASCNEIGETGWTRLLIEKPFGRDETSAKALNDRLAKIFSEEQVYRLDHYLAKDGVMALKPLNDPKSVKKISFSLLETMSVEGRGPFYETVGALRDVGQNHLLSIFTILTGLSPDSLTPLSAEWAQYEGYRQVAGVAPDSKVETYFKVLAKLNEGEWQDVEIVLAGGKKMPAIKKEVVVEHKDGRQEIFPFELSQHAQYVAEYERLFLDAIVGGQERFLSREEVESAWRFIDQVVAGWRDDIIKTYV